MKKIFVMIVFFVASLSFSVFGEKINDEVLREFVVCVGDEAPAKINIHDFFNYEPDVSSICFKCECNNNDCRAVRVVCPDEKGKKSVKPKK